MSYTFYDDSGKQITREEYRRMRGLNGDYRDNDSTYSPGGSSLPGRSISVNKRVGNTTRNRYVEHLSNMMAEGFLTEEEFDERQTKALATQYEAELVLLVADLEPLPRVPIQEPLKVRRNLGFDRHEHKAWLWLFTSLFSLSMILAQPVLAAIQHGFDHIGPGTAGVLPVLAILLGTVSTIIFGIGLAPGEMEEKY